jgi:hypothetical protein
VTPEIRYADGTVRQGRTSTARDAAIRSDPDDITYLRIDHQVRFQVEDVEIAIGCPFVLDDGSGGRHALDPERRGELGPVLALYPDTVAVEVADDATLVLRFGIGVTITVPPDPRYEAWELRGPGSRLVVCNPGQDLSVWR